VIFTLIKLILHFRGQFDLYYYYYYYYYWHIWLCPILLTQRVCQPACTFSVLFHLSYAAILSFHFSHINMASNPGYRMLSLPSAKFFLTIFSANDIVRWLALLHILGGPGLKTCSTHTHTHTHTYCIYWLRLLVVFLGPSRQTLKISL
jgi:hypothetical protein